MKKFIYVFAIFSLGYMAHDLVHDFVKPAQAEVAGMSRFDLMYDWDFKSAVESIVDDKISNLEHDISSLKLDVSDLESRIIFLE